MLFLRCGQPLLRSACEYGRCRASVRPRAHYNAYASAVAIGSRNIHHKPVARSDDTIYALSTAAGRAAIAIIRISGPACLNIYQQLCPKTRPPKPKTATLRKLLSPNDARVLDPRALILHFPAPNTVTGEDVLELHIHGGPAIVRSVLEAIPKAANLDTKDVIARPAEAGEFTKRAFYNNRIDLTEVEALGEALAAETEQQRALAVSGAASGLTQRYEEWRSMLLHARAELEALIDFSEDQHFDESPAEFVQSVSKQIEDLKSRLELHILNASRGELLRSGINVALLGPPNAGKSSLLNRIVGREAAIVSTEAGTTRDIVDVSIDVNGWLVRLGDMAGVRAALAPVPSPVSATEDLQTLDSIVGEIEKEGIRRARQRALESDLVIVLVPLQLDAQGAVGLVVNEELLDAVRQCQDAGKAMLLVLNKTDLLHRQTGITKTTLSRLLSQVLDLFPFVEVHDVFCLSCLEAEKINLNEPDPGGLQTFLAGLTGKFSSMTSALIGTVYESNTVAGLTPAEAQSYWTSSLSITHRQSTLLKECLDHITAYLESTSTQVVQTIEHDLRSVPLNESYRMSTPNQNFKYFATDELHATKTEPMMTSEHGFHTDNHDDIVAQIEHNIKTSPIRAGSQLEDEASSKEDVEVDIVAAAEHLRYAADCLSKLTGRDDGTASAADVEDVLGVVFERYVQLSFTP